jgi:hypothetical protein
MWYGSCNLARFPRPDYHVFRGGANLIPGFVGDLFGTWKYSPMTKTLFFPTHGRNWAAACIVSLYPFPIIDTWGGY